MTNLGLNNIFLIFITILIRLIIPVEFSFAKSIGVPYVLPEIYSILSNPIITLFGKDLNLINLLSLIWVIGIIVNCISTIYTYAIFKRKVQLMDIVKDANVNSILKDILKELNIHKSFKILESSTFSTPVLYGYLNR